MLYCWVIALLRCSIVEVCFQLGIVLLIALVVLVTLVVLAMLVVPVTDCGIMEGSLLD